MDKIKSMPKKTKGGKKAKKIKIQTNFIDTSRDHTKKGSLKSSGKELQIDKILDKKKEITEKEVFDFTPKNKM
tara:strand:- start:1040 stop:1258 length:219 start_codon:yes stop_codon:yes gene_type:complete